MDAQQQQAASPSTTDGAGSDALWHALKGCLEEKRDQIYEEIQGYRPPIPACDVQFNYLLEERSRVYQELSQLNTLAKQDLPAHDLLLRLDAFLAASVCIDAATKARLQARCLDVNKV